MGRGMRRMWCLSRRIGRQLWIRMQMRGCREMRRRGGLGRWGKRKKREEKAVKEKTCDALLLKVNQIGLVTESIEAVKMSKRAGWGVMTSHRSPIFQHSNPSSPKSPSTFSLLRLTLRLSKNQLICPVCNSTWKELPLLPIHPSNQRSSSLVNDKKREVVSRNEAKSDYNNPQRKQYMRPDLKVYNDDEPLRSPISVARFNPKPELDENEDEDNENNYQEFQGFFLTAVGTKKTYKRKLLVYKNGNARMVE
ncbi:hypothetical protein AgCh_035897 [Apium graveolens]